MAPLTPTRLLRCAGRLLHASRRRGLLENVHVLRRRNILGIVVSLWIGLSGGLSRGDGGNDAQHVAGQHIVKLVLLLVRCALASVDRGCLREQTRRERTHVFEQRVLVLPSLRLAIEALVVHEEVGL